MKNLFERMLASIQYILPQHFLSRMVYSIMRCEVKWLKNFLINSISNLAGIDRQEALSTDLGDYKCFNAWFTRELKPDARIFDPAPNAYLSPSDGRVSESGPINSSQIFQAKGKDYSIQELLAEDEICPRLRNGWFSTIYLSPRDYHRVHMPMSGRLTRMIHVPGKLFSVAPYTVRQVPRLFARNERVICIFETESGPMVMVLVGAMLVSSMETVWAGQITPSNNKNITISNYSDRTITLEKGQEMGRFNMGSTVILLMPGKKVDGEPELTAGTAVKVGQRLATIL